ncbi:MAG: pilus assembly protein PilM [Patescibacteria group bacterium]
MVKNFFSLLWRLSSQPLVGGLEINDSAVRFLRVDGEKTKTASLRLPPGIIVDGKINDRQNFLAVLKAIRLQLVKSQASQKIHVIISLPASVVYSQSFSIPMISQENVGEAAELNLQMISPISLEKAYSDWQVTNTDIDHQKEILGAFAEKTIIDEYDSILRESGFLPVAFEFPALSLTRLIKEMGPAIDQDKSYLLISVSTDGLNFMIIRKGELHFNHFLFWRTLQGEKRQIIFSDFKNILSQETQKILNFVSTDLEESLEGVIVMSPTMEKEIEEIIKKEFGLKTILLRLKRYGDFSAAWFIAIGSALRGLIPRRQDVLISLSSRNVVDEFYHEQALSFIALWRNIFLVFSIVLLIVFGGVDILFGQIQKNTKNQFSSLIAYPRIQEVAGLQEKAAFFNESVALISAAKRSIFDWSSFFKQLNDLAGNQIVLDKILIQSFTTPVRIQGRADNERTIVNFKNALSSQPGFRDVSLSLTSIRSTSDRRMNFELSFVFSPATGN